MAIQQKDEARKEAFAERMLDELNAASVIAPAFSTGWPSWRRRPARRSLTRPG
jgi:hypothetical protein